MPTTEVLTESATSKYMQTTKWKLHYNEAGDGHPLILLHGGGAGASGWSNYSRNIPSLARHYRVFAIDMPGWGKSDTAVPGDRDHVIALYEAYVAAVKAAVPAHRLLVHAAADGWEPLCAHLGVPVPDQPYPRRNSTDDFLRMVAAATAQGATNRPGGP